MRRQPFGSRQRRRALEGLDQDIRDHIDRETQDNIDKGMPPDEARRQAMLTFGNVALVTEDTRHVWVPAWLDEARCPPPQRSVTRGRKGTGASVSSH